jgi:hypothetical protein
MVTLKHFVSFFRKSGYSKLQCVAKNFAQGNEKHHMSPQNVNQKCPKYKQYDTKDKILW